MEKTGGSRLLQMKARFQQKQMAEREMKITSLYEAQQARALDRVRHSPASTNVTHVTVKTVPAISPPPLNTAVQPGKVRQMFEERRSKAGIDKSHPLQPIHNTSRQVARKPATNGHPKTTSKPPERKPVRATLSNGNVRKTVTKSEHSMNGAGDVNHNHEANLNVAKHASQTQPSRRQPVEELVDELDRPGEYRLEDETFPQHLAPEPTPRSPTDERRSPDSEPQRPPRRNAAVKSNPSVKPQPMPVPPPRRTGSGENASVIRSQPMQKVQPVPSKKISSSSSKVRSPAAAASPAPGDGAPCPVCGRRFAPDRVAKHEQICRKTQTKKRKPFDALKHRLAGTEAEPLLNKIRKGQTQPTSSTKIKPLNSNWRKKHEEFISTIRAAKQVQAHLNAGGKLSDLPPPPPSENPDYVQCPHCSRRFNQAAAERHIPKCASFQFNKPKGPPKRR